MLEIFFVNFLFCMPKKKDHYRKNKELAGVV